MKQEQVVRGIEQRFETTEQGDGSLVIRGYFSLFNQSAYVNGYREKVDKGAFKRALESGEDVVALHDHDWSKVLGRLSNGTLKLVEDDNGLYGEIYPPTSQWVNDMYLSMKRGDLKGASFGYPKAHPNVDVKVIGRDRIIRNAPINEVTLTPRPVYGGPSLEAEKRAWETAIEEEGSLDTQLKDIVDRMKDLGIEVN